jgi:anti-sigma factor RsiW
MTCLSAEELAALFDGRLSRARAERARAHLAACPRCAAEIQSLNRLVQVASADSRPAPPEGLRARALGLGEELPAPAAALPAGARDSLTSRDSD